MNIDKHLDKNGLTAGDDCSADAANIAEQIQRHGLDDFKKELYNLESDQRDNMNTWLGLLAADDSIFTNDYFMSVDHGTLIPVLQDELNRYASTDEIATFFDGWDGASDALNSIAPPITKNDLLYYNNPSAYLKGYADTVGYGFIDTALAGISGFQYLSYLNSAVSMLGIDEAPVKAHLATIKTNQGEDFWLAEHHMYGSSRIGIKNYWQSQHYSNFNYDTSQTSPVVDSLTLTSRKPWYSDDYQDVIDVAYLTPWGNTYTSPFTLQHTLGQKGYELNNHLGNVQAVVSDKRVAASFKHNDTIDSYRPSLMAAYDYYPFGMLMPGRYVSDTSQQCAWVTTTKFVPVWVYGIEWDKWACGPPACGFTLISGGGVSTVNPGTSTAVLAISVSHADAGVWNMMDVSPGLETSLLINIAHVDDGATFIAQVDEETDTGWHFLTNATVHGTEDLTLNFTPSQAQVKISFILTGKPTGYKTLQVKNIKHWYLTYQQQTENTLVCNGAKDNYRFGFNGQEKTNEIAGIGNHNTAMFWEYDTRLGRRWNLDPKPNVWESQYSVMGGNPVLNIDVLGDIWGNIYEKNRSKLLNNKNELQNKVDSYQGDKSKNYYKRMVKKLNNATDAYNNNEEKFLMVKNTLKDLSEHNNSLYNRIENLKDPVGNDVTVYVGIQQNLYSDVFGDGGMDEFMHRKKLDGISRADKDIPISIQEFGSDKIKNVFTVSTQRYGANTAIILIDASIINKGKIVSHEGGHVEYEVKNMYEYRQWLNANPGKSEGGHGGGNPSGKAAETEEDNYK